MRLRRGLAALMLALAACGPMSPQSYTASVPRPAGDVFTCALRNLGELGYTVTDSEREGGLIRAEKPDGAGSTLLAGEDYYSELTVVVLASETGSGADLRVTATRTRGESGGRSSGGMALSERIQAEAKALTDACSR